jgi:hypothetical protein
MDGVVPMVLRDGNMDIIPLRGFPPIPLEYDIDGSPTLDETLKS